MVADIPWSMSASLQGVWRAGVSLTEMTSLEEAAREWLLLTERDKDLAVLTPARPFQWRDEGDTIVIYGRAIGRLAEALPPTIPCLRIVGA